jgi:hypothetical protein
MTAPVSRPPKRIQLHFDVATDDQAQELSAAWEKIVSGKQARVSIHRAQSLSCGQRRLSIGPRHESQK